MLEIASRKKSIDDDFHDDTAGIDALGNVRTVASNVVPHISGSVRCRIITATASITADTTCNQLRESLEGCVAGATFNYGVKCQEAKEGTAVLELDL